MYIYLTDINSERSISLIGITISVEEPEVIDKEELEEKKDGQDSCAIAKMTAKCALYMGALKIFGTP